MHLKSLHKATESDQTVSLVTLRSLAPEIDLLDTEIGRFAQHSSPGQPFPLIYSLLQGKAQRSENHPVLFLTFNEDQSLGGKSDGP